MAKNLIFATVDYNLFFKETKMNTNMKVISELLGKETSEEFVSMSTIDSPPSSIDLDSESNTDDSDLDEESKQKHMYVGERVFQVEMILKLKPAGGQNYTLPVYLNQGLRGTLVEDALALALKDLNTVHVIQAILDNPKDRTKVIDGPAEEKQRELF